MLKHNVQWVYGVLTLNVSGGEHWTPHPHEFMISIIFKWRAPAPFQKQTSTEKNLCGLKIGIKRRKKSIRNLP